MTHSLQKTILSFFVSAFMVIAFAGTSQAQDNLNALWERTTVADDLPDWFTASSVRGMAYNIVDGNERLYVADRANHAIQVVDPETGTDVTLDTPFDLTDVSGGSAGYDLNTIEVSDDGAIFLANLSLDASNGNTPFKFYIWNEEGGTFDNSYSFTSPSAQRLGDRFTVVGSLEDNTIEVWFPVAGATENVVYVATTEDQGVNWSVETITLTDGVTGTGADVEPLAAGRDSDFYVGGNSAAPARYNSDGELIEGTALSSSSKSGITAFNVGGTDHLAVYAFRNDGENVGDRIGRVFVYDISDASSPSLVAESSLMGDTDGGWQATSGDVKVVTNDDGSYNLYAVDAINGLAAYQSEAPAPASEDPENLFFSEYIEGSGNNKALEVYNASDSDVNLANYRLLGSNGGSDWKDFNEFAADAAIAAGDVYVIITDQVDSELFAAENADEVVGYRPDSPVHFNGNDARALIHVDPASNDTTWLDVFGDPNSDADWDVAGVSPGSTGYTLLRKATVTEGNNTALGSFGTNADDSEWIVLAEDDFSNLGAPTSEYTPALAGEYYIPQGDNEQGFGSMAAAINAINEAGLSGATTLYIADDLTETDIIKLERDDLSETNTLTVKPALGTTPTLSVIGGSGGDGFWIETTDWVTIDGSNTEDGTTKDLTITSADPSFSAVVYVTNSSNVTVKNTNVTYTGGDSNIYGVIGDVSGDGVLSNFHVENNTIGTAAGEFRNTVTLWGSEANPAQGSVINNIIYTNHRGITTYLNVNNTFSGNTITIANPGEENYYAGMYLAAMNGVTNVIGNEISGMSVNRTETPVYAAGILINSNLDTVNIVNNIISAADFKNTGAATGNSVFGMYLNNPSGDAQVSVYHNTVHIGSSSETGIHAAFGSEEVSTTQIWDFQNNIFSVAQDAENAYAFHWPMDTTGLSANYNNYNVIGSGASVGFVGAGEDGAATATLADWQAATEEDENSTDVFVEFVSDTDLRLAGESIGDHALAGTPLASVTTDIDGTVRSETHPYKGAFEGETPVPNEIEDSKPNAFSLSQNYPNPFNPTSNIKFTLPQTSNVKLEVYNMTGQLVSTLVNDRLNAGEHTVQFNAGNLASGVYIYRIQAGSFAQTKKMTLIK